MEIPFKSFDVCVKKNIADKHKWSHKTYGGEVDFFSAILILIVVFSISSGIEKSVTGG